ncbi:MAG: replicative DNA helicase [Bacteriophage sp.]|nr:MAG: replicative DNA helicase [Bacteriophage sp.]
MFDELESTDHLSNATVQAEYGVLAVLLLNNEAYDRIAHFLRPEHFSTVLGQKVYKSISKSLSKGQSCDVITVFEDLSRTDPNNDISIVELGKIAQGEVAPRMLTRYAESIVEKAQERQLVQAVNQAYELSTDQTLSVNDRVARIAALLDQSSQKANNGNEPVRIGDLVPAYIEKVNAYAEGREAPPLIPTGIKSLDRFLDGGMADGKVYVIAARPSVGKSASAQAICEHAASEGFASALFSQEMVNEEMLERAISRQGGVNMGFHKKPRGMNDDFGFAMQAADKLRDMPFWLYDGAGLRLQEIASRARMLKRKHGLRLLAIDYLQLCQSVNPRLSRHHQIEEISRGIKMLAKELGIPIILLSQLGRDVEKRTPPRPLPSDLKESGAIEEDADVIILMWPHEKGDSDVLIGFDIAKNRGGRKGEFGCRFVGKYQQWHDSDESLRAPVMAKKESAYGF